MNRRIISLLVLISMLMLTACSGSQTADNPTPAMTAVPNMEASGSATEGSSQAEPTPSEVPPIPTPTEMPPKPTEVPPTPTPTEVPPTPTPTPTEVPPTPTPTPPVSYTVVDTFGFSLTLDGEVNVENSGLSSDNANITEGVIFFEYSGANSILMWFEDTESEIDSVLSDTYTSFVESQSDVTFLLLDEGNVTVGANTGKYLSFSTTNSSGDSGGGIIGSWRCSSGKVFASTATGSDATVVQIRFKRLLDGFACEI